MLLPTNRLTLLDAMRPPMGFRLESAMAVTFTLDLRALLAAPAAFTLTAPDGVVAEEGHVEPIELLHALRSNADRITVLCQVGEIALPPSRRVFAFLERSVVPVRAPRGGIVHPKVWVLRYEAIDDPPEGQERERRLRVLVSSRNLTFDASWDTVIRLDEATGQTGATLGAVGDLFEGLLATASIATREHSARVRSLSAALRGAVFAMPPGVRELSVHVLGLTHGPSPLPTTADRSLIISPFVTDDFFASAWPHPVDELVSRPEALEALGAAVRERVTTIYAFDDGSAMEVETGDDDRSPFDPGRPLVGLHAKVFAFEAADRARLFLGSANATGAAFRRNVEILIELVGPIATLGIDRLCDGTGDEPGLRALFRPLSALPPRMESAPTTVVDRMRREIAQLAIEGVVEESGAGWAVTYRSDQQVPHAGGIEVHCWPLASQGNQRRVEPGRPLDVRFETSLEAISGFLAFEANDAEGTKTAFVVPVPLAGVPDQRDRLLLRLLVGGAERFLRYLLALLEEDRAQVDLLDAIESTTMNEVEPGLRGSTLPVLEKLLRTMRRDPKKLQALHPLVSDLAADDALPPGFAELWTTVYDVAVARAAEG